MHSTSSVTGEKHNHLRHQPSGRGYILSVTALWAAYAATNSVNMIQITFNSLTKRSSLNLAQFNRRRKGKAPQDDLQTGIISRQSFATEAQWSQKTLRVCNCILVISFLRREQFKIDLQLASHIEKHGRPLLPYFKYQPRGHPDCILAPIYGESALPCVVVPKGAEISCRHTGGQRTGHCSSQHLDSGKWFHLSSRIEQKK